jgi:methyltransferase (TIGR00027 family)
MDNTYREKTYNELTTAEICAFSRALEAKTNPGIFCDNFAYDLLGESEFENVKASLKSVSDSENPEEYTNDLILPVTASRLRFTEQKLDAFAKKYGRCQYVICGAGYDTFALRNKNPNIEIFEVDHPKLQAEKIARIHSAGLKIPDNLHFTAVDFETDDFKNALLSSGFDREKKTFFSILGVSYYLSLKTFTKTISFIAEMASAGSRLVFDYPGKGFRNSPRSRLKRLADLAQNLGETMDSGYDIDELWEAMRTVDFMIESHLAPTDIQNLYFNNSSLRAINNIYIVSANKKAAIEYNL